MGGGLKGFTKVTCSVFSYKKEAFRWPPLNSMPQALVIWLLIYNHFRSFFLDLWGVKWFMGVHIMCKLRSFCSFGSKKVNFPSIYDGRSTIRSKFWLYPKNLKKTSEVTSISILENFQSMKFWSNFTQKMPHYILSLIFKSDSIAEIKWALC